MRLKGIVPLMSFSIMLSAAPVWQLGVEDGSAKEFLDVNNGEFRTNPRILNSKNYDAEKRVFRYEIPAGGVIETPQMPGGIAGDNSINESIVRTQNLLWNERSPGWRELEIRILPGPRNMKSYFSKPNANMDIDGSDVPKYGLRIQAPGNRVHYTYLPYNLPHYLKQRGETALTVRFRFPVKAGKNELILHENSGKSYGRCYRFDYVRLSEAQKPEKQSPVAEYAPGKGFPYRSVYESKNPAELKVSFHNLEQGKQYRGTTRFIDFFGGEVAAERYAPVPDNDGFAVVDVKCPRGINGHFTVETTLTADGKPEKLQMDSSRAETRIAAVRMIAPLSEEEIDRSCVGLSGIWNGGMVKTGKFAKQPDDYRMLRRFLQVHHERLHWLAWYVVEPVEGKRDWSYFDALADAEHKDRIRLQVNLMGTPDWLLKKHKPEILKQDVWKRWLAVPPDMDAFAGFCADAARRYRGKVSELEIWNEVSEYSMFWPNGNAKQFVELVKKASQAIRKEAPEMKIAVQTLWARQNTFTKEIFEAGIANYVDVHMDHYVTDRRIDLNRSVLNRYGLPARFVCNEERADRAANSQADAAARREAARNLIRNYLYDYTHGVTRIYNFKLISTAWRMWGMVGPDMTPKYSYSAFKTLNNRLTGTRPAGYRRLSEYVERFELDYFSPVRIRENGGDSAVVLTNSGKDKVTISLPASGAAVTAVDIMDNEKRIPVENNMVTLELTQNPVFLYGIDRKMLAVGDSLKIEPETLNLRPGGVCSIGFRLPDSSAKLSVAPSFGKRRSVTLKPGTAETLKLPVPETIENGIYSIVMEGMIFKDGKKIPCRQELNVTVEDKAPGEQLLPPMNKNHYVFWGSVKGEFANGGVSGVIGKEKTGAVRLMKAVNVIPRAEYYLGLTVSGKGSFRVMAQFLDRNGKPVKTMHNLLLERLEKQAKPFSGQFSIPPDASSVMLHFYQYQEKDGGEFKLSDCRLIRIENDVPRNRQLIKTTAKPAVPVKIDGNLDDWKSIPFVPVTDTAFGGESIQAEFAVMWDPSALYLAVKVRDKIHFNPYKNENVWQGDSVQFALEPAMAKQKAPAVQLAFALTNAGPWSYCHSTVPVPELIPSYTRGPSPEGIEFAVRRDGEYTYYEIKAPAERLRPSLELVRGKSMAFSLLVNNNDGEGRSWRQWSSGIGQAMDSSLFGTLTLE